MDKAKLAELRDVLSAALKRIEMQLESSAGGFFPVFSLDTGVVGVPFLVVEILGLDWPLSIVQIHNKVGRFGRCCSYQAVFKAVKALEEKGALEKSGRLYQLNRDWLANAAKQLGIIAKNYGLVLTGELSGSRLNPPAISIRAQA